MDHPQNNLSTPGGSAFPPLPPADAMLLLLPPLSLPKTQGPDLELWNTRAFQQFQEPAGSTEERQRQLDWARPFCFRGAIYVLYKDGVWKNRKGLENVVTMKKGQIRRHFRWSKAGGRARMGIHKAWLIHSPLLQAGATSVSPIDKEAYSDCRCEVGQRARPHYVKVVGD